MNAKQLHELVYTHVTNRSLMPSHMPARMAAVLAAHPGVTFTLSETDAFRYDKRGLYYTLSLIARQPLTPIIMSAMLLADPQAVQVQLPTLSVEYDLARPDAAKVVRFKGAYLQHVLMEVVDHVCLRRDCPHADLLLPQASALLTAFDDMCLAIPVDADYQRLGRLLALAQGRNPDALEADIDDADYLHGVPVNAIDPRLSKRFKIKGSSFSQIMV